VGIGANRSRSVRGASAIEEYATLGRPEMLVEQSKRIRFLAQELRNALSSATMGYASLKKRALGVNDKTGDILERSLATMRNLDIPAPWS
jgi:hypothetical protein